MPKKSALLLLFALISATLLQTALGDPPPGNFVRTFDEEFNGIQIYNYNNYTDVWQDNANHPGQWTTYYNVAGPTRNLYGTGERQLYVDSYFAGQDGNLLGVNPFSTTGGILKIQAIQTPPALGSRAWGYAYLSGLLTTQHSFNQTYGYFEIRAQLPAGLGMFPAFWMLSTVDEYSTECDVFECFGAPSGQGGGSNWMHWTIHDPNVGGTNHGVGDWYIAPNANIYTGFHTYGVDWEPNGVTFYFDGVKMADTQPCPADWNTPKYMLVNLAIGSNWAGFPDGTTPWPANEYVDYVRAYANAGLNVSESSFEDPTVSNYQYNQTGTPWTYSTRSGLAANAGGFTSYNPNAPSGSQVAFLQMGGTISQTLTSSVAGGWSISFQAAQRYNNTQTINVLIDNVSMGMVTPTNTSYGSYTVNAPSVTAGPHVLTFKGVITATDQTALIDSIAVNVTTNPATDCSFETPSAGGGIYYNAPGSPWTFTGLSGVTANNTGFTSANPNAPDGSQVAFLQKTGIMSQSVTSATAGLWAVSFKAAQRYQNQTVNVMIDGVSIGSVTPTGMSYGTYSVNSTSCQTAGTHTLALQGTATTDQTAFIDTLAVAVVPNPVGDYSFETSSMAGNYQYNPAGSPWTFVGAAGLTPNGTSINPGTANAPSGTQVALIEQGGSMSQPVYEGVAGAWSVTFQAAQRAYNHETLTVLVDGNSIGSVIPASTSYNTYTLNGSTILQPGTHTLTFQGSSGWDDMAFVDTVTVKLH